MLTRRQMMMIVSSGKEKIIETRYQEVRKDAVARNWEEVNHAHQGERRMCVRAVGIYAASEV